MTDLVSHPAPPSGPVASSAPAAPDAGETFFRIIDSGPLAVFAQAESRMSLFASARATTPRAEITIAGLVAMVRAPEPEFAARLAAAREALENGETERFAALKRELPAVSIAGTFSARNNKGLLVHSGLMPIDLDHLTPEAMADAKRCLNHDPFCAFYFVSPSGLTEACEESGWKIYAWVLMSNHYHWVLQTPEGNLVEGMKWFQNTYTRRLNTRDGKWVHVFGGRYKAVLVESEGGRYLETLMDFVHLNPVRAGLVDVDEGKGLLEYELSSLSQGYGVAASHRPVWLAVKEALELFGYSDGVKERRKFVKRLEARAREDEGKVENVNEGLQNTLQRGWYWGSQEFRGKMLKLAKKVGVNRNYRTSEQGRQRDRPAARYWLKKTREHFQIGAGTFAEAPRNVRLAAAWALHHRTNQRQGWIAQELGLHTAANVSQQVRRIDSPNPPEWTKDRAWIKWAEFVRNC